MNETERAIFDRVVSLSSATRWPSGRRVLVAERRWMIRFLADWVRSLGGRSVVIPIEAIAAAMADPLVGPMVDAMLARRADA